MISTVVVVIPARDEQDEIAACLTGVQVASDELARVSDGAVQAQVIVVLDNCRDDTASIVDTFPAVDAVVSAAGRVGAARRCGADAALASRKSEPTESIWLASTDADCVVPPHWLSRMVQLADSGADLVLGTVVPAPGLAAVTSAAWTAAHPGGDGHPHVHGANLGIGAVAYLALGGWDDLACYEDVALVTRAVGAGLDVRRVGDLCVQTSSRLQGRAPHGFAGYLRGLPSLPDAG